MQLLTAKVKSTPRNVTTKHGERSVMDVILSDGTETAIWGPANFEAIHNCSQGQAVQLTKDSKNKLHIVETETAIAPKTETKQTEIKTDYSLSKTDKQAIASYIQQQRDLLAFCWEQAKSIPGHELEDTTEKLAVTLYLSAQRKFNLA